MMESKRVSVEIDPRLKKYWAKSGTGESSQKTIYEHTEDVLRCLYRLIALGYVRDEDIIRLTSLACCYHDVGKINDLFQKRILSDKKIKFNIDTELPHNLLSILSIPLQHRNQPYTRALAYAIANHHHTNLAEFMNGGAERLNKEAKKYRLSIDSSDDSGVANETPLLFPYKSKFLTSIKDIFEQDEIQGNSEERKAEIANTILTTGLLMKCDYAASGGYEVEYGNDFLEGSLERLISSWSKGDKKAEWNELQKFCQKNSDENIIAIGETGMGKTEGALLWLGNNKGFFFLPVRTAINAIYDRVSDDLLQKNPNVGQQVALLHSGDLAYYLEKFKNNDGDTKSPVVEPEINVEEYRRRGRSLSMPLTISTVDQLFTFVFRNHGYELKLATLSYSKLIIDEIQMYDATLLAYLIYGLECVSELGGKIAIVTATLPPFVENLLRQRIPFQKGVFTKKSKARHNIKIKHERINTADIVEQYNLKTKETCQSNKILVICNTIKEAQRLYRELKDLLATDDIHLFHSRFIKADRKEKEKDILRFGKTYTEDGLLDCRKGIWITTSICEASLDIDFDYLFTELQYLPSLWQRFGRCNRKGVKQTDLVNCFVYTEIEESLLKGSYGMKANYSKKSGTGFIDRTLYELSKSALDSLDGLITEEDKLERINLFFTTETVQESPYYKELIDTYNLMRSRVKGNQLEALDGAKLRNISSIDIIPYAVYSQHEEYLTSVKSYYTKANGVERNAIKLRLEEFTVSIRSSTYYAYCAKPGRVRKSPVNITEYWQIPIFDCHYDEEIGLIPDQPSKESSECAIL